ncbi:MaoC family dehydratase [Sphingomicrobium lutaoense]|uniref:Acyl dehydratase n=1 Tax=Sphingomicrobium lutaoense TaxID=515949 RepID=A0A839Z2X5_9SPHN|nr:MaoC family dehydratase [Sphingomicrobium lutaoense]MBB3763972.1 acyl dehydratase [Sphingomicrobium lutaoense]
MTTWFEDISVGDRIECGEHEVTREEVLEFARKYDPQPFHLDDEAAAKTPFGRIAASGWHTGAMVMRLIVDCWTEKKLMGVGSPGLDELRWLKPVYPGDTIRVSSEVVDMRPSRSRPERGTLWTDVFVHNQHNELVMRYRSIVMVMRRPSGD